MGKLVSFESMQVNRQHFAIVLAKDEQSYRTAVDFFEAVQSESGEASQLVLSFYLVDQLPMLKSAGILRDYSVCFLVGMEGAKAQELQPLRPLKNQLPLLAIKSTGNVSDLFLNDLCTNTLCWEDFTANRFSKTLYQSIQNFKRNNFLKRVDSIHKQTVGFDIYQSDVVEADTYDAEWLVSEVVDSMRSVARARGVDLGWAPVGERLPVFLTKQNTKHSLMEIMLELFDFYTSLKVGISPRSLVCDRCVWLDINAYNLRSQESFQPEHSEALQQLRSVLRKNQGELFILDRNNGSVTLRIEWLLFSQL